MEPAEREEQGCLDYLTPVIETTAILRRSPDNAHALRRRDEMVRRAARAHTLAAVAEAAELSPRATAEIVLSGPGAPAPPKRGWAARSRFLPSALEARRLL